MLDIKNVIVNLAQLGIEIIECPRCDGTGRRNSWWRSVWCMGDCPTCHGEGMVWRKVCLK